MISTKYFTVTLMVLTASSAFSSKPPKKDIHHVTLNSSVTLTDKGFFKDRKSVAQFLACSSAYIHCPHPKITRLSEDAHLARFGTSQLFAIECDGSSYIMKEIKDTRKKPAHEEIDRLELVRRSRRLREYLDQGKDNLKLIVPCTYLSYRDQKNKRHIVVLLKKSHGISLQKLMQRFHANPKDKGLHAHICTAFYDLGASLARFYRSVGNGIEHTMTHRDLHGGNIFYDLQTGITTLIDNERMATGGLADPSSISRDLGSLFTTSPFVLAWADGDFLTYFAAKKWYSIIIPSFVCGFIRTYDKSKRKDIFKQLKKFTLEWQANVDKDESRPLRGLIKEQFSLLERQLIDEKKSTLHIVAGNRRLTALVKRLLAEKTKACTKVDRDGNIPLHEAAYFGHHEALTLLIKAGSPLSQQNGNGETPLFKAKYNHHEGAIRILANLGACS